MSDYQWILQSCALVVSAFFIVLQLRQNQRINKAQYIANVNSRLADMNDCIDDLFSIKAAGDFDNLKKSKQERILDYFTIFEVLEALRRNRVIKTPEVSYFFGGRLGDITSNEGLQKGVLFGPHGDMLSPIFSLHSAIVKYRKKRIAERIVFNQMGDLESIDPVLYRERSSRKLI